MNVALITGITGQDGSYLAEFLLSKGYEVHGIIRRSSSFNTKRIDHIFDKLYLHYGDLSDASNINNLIREIKPSEIYHLAAMSHVRVSFDEPIYTTDIGALGTLRLLEAVRNCGFPIKVYNAASSEMFGASPPPQNENTPFAPRSPYGVAKVSSFYNCVNYRDGYKLFISNGILFNHTSPRRGLTFVSRKITHGLASILAGKQDKLYLGNLNVSRDWGFAPEYVELMFSILQYSTPLDICIGTGTRTTIKQFIEKACQYAGVPVRWKNDGITLKGIAYRNKEIIAIDYKYYRPTEVENLQCDATKAKELLRWEPRVSIDDIIKIMMDYDFINAGLQPVGDGIKLVSSKNFNWSVL